MSASTKSKKIPITGVRDFSDKISASFNLVIQNYKLLFKGVAIVGLPIMILAVLLIVKPYSHILEFGTDPTSDLFGAFGMMDILLMVLGALIFMFSYVFILGFTYAFWYVYERDEVLELNAVFAVLRDKILNLAGSVIFLFFLFIMVMVAMIAVVSAVGFLDLTWLTAIMVLGFLVVLIYLFVPSNIYVYLRLREELPFVAAFKKAIRITHPNWWGNLGFYIVMSFILSVLSYVVMIPVYMLIVVNLFTSTGELNATGLMSTFAYLVISVLLYGVYYMITATAQAVLYYDNLERVDGLSVWDEIESIGGRTQSAFENEGEY